MPGRKAMESASRAASRSLLSSAGELTAHLAAHFLPFSAPIRGRQLASREGQPEGEASAEEAVPGEGGKKLLELLGQSHWRQAAVRRESASLLAAASAHTVAHTAADAADVSVISTGADATGVTEGLAATTSISSGSGGGSGGGIITPNGAAWRKARGVGKEKDSAHVLERLVGGGGVNGDGAVNPQTMQSNSDYREWHMGCVW